MPLTTHLRPITSAELAAVENTRNAYRSMWAKLKHVPVRTFNGEREDIDALNFIDYEAGLHPEGASGAAIIFGNVLVRSGVFDWAIADESWFAIVTTSEYPRVTILPHLRLIEIEGSSWPAPGGGQRFDWLLEEIIVRLAIGGLDRAQLQPLMALVYRSETPYWNAMKTALTDLWQK